MFHALQSRLAGTQSAILYVVLVALCLVFLGLVVPAYTRIFVDRYLVGGVKSWLPYLFVFMGVTGLLQIVFTWLQQQQLLRFETRLSITTSTRSSRRPPVAHCEFFYSTLCGRHQFAREHQRTVAQFLR
jgi:ABC-type bacteriocin/lantibiotic exporter with double-glycine peptidase domain